MPFCIEARTYPNSKAFLLGFTPAFNFPKIKVSAFIPKASNLQIATSLCFFRGEPKIIIRGRAALRVLCLNPVRMRGLAGRWTTNGEVLVTGIENFLLLTGNDLDLVGTAGCYARRYLPNQFSVILGFLGYPLVVLP